MRIVGVELIRLALPLETPFETSSHRKREIEHILVRAVDESGLVGWGEIASGGGPWFSGEDVETAWHVASAYLVDAVLDATWRSPAELEERWAGIAANFAAKAGFDMAAWSLHAARSGRSLAACLGGRRDAVDAGVSVGIEASTAALVDRVAGYLGDGYRRVKLKIRPGWDAAPVRAVREAFPDLVLHVDANGGYSPAEAHVVAGLEPFGLAMIEQPFPARELVAHAELARRIATPVCLDESVETTGDLEAALALGAIGVLNVKVSRVGGLTPAVRLVERCAAHGIPVWCGGMHEFGVGRAANLALSSRPEFDYPGDVSASRKYFRRDVLHAPIESTDGRIGVPSGPGLGVEVDEEFVRDRARAIARFGDTPGRA